MQAIRQTAPAQGQRREARRVSSAYLFFVTLNLTEAGLGSG